MDLKQLGYFAHVAELGSFTKAAALLSVAQSALSHQVRQLEVELKQTLLIRNGRGVAPTDAGKRLLGHARGILMQVERARDDLAESRGAPVGNVAGVRTAVRTRTWCGPSRRSGVDGAGPADRAGVRQIVRRCAQYHPNAPAF